MDANGRMMGRLDSKSVMLLRMCFVRTRFERREILVISVVHCVGVIRTSYHRLWNNIVCLWPHNYSYLFNLEGVQFVCATQRTHALDVGQQKLLDNR